MWSSLISVGLALERRGGVGAADLSRRFCELARRAPRRRAPRAGSSSSQSPTRSKRIIACDLVERRRALPASVFGEGSRTAREPRVPSSSKGRSPRASSASNRAIETEGPSSGASAARTRASSRTTATPEAPSLAPTKPGMSFVSWWAPTTTVPSPVPGIVATTFRYGRCTSTSSAPASRRRSSIRSRPSRRSPASPTAAGRSRPAPPGPRTRARRRSAAGAGSPGSSAPQPASAKAREHQEERRKAPERG